MAVCALEPGAAAVPQQGAAQRCLWPWAVWSLGAGAAAARRCQMSTAGRCGQMCGRVRLELAARCLWPCALWSLGAGAAGGRCRVPLRNIDTSMRFLFPNRTH